MSISFAEAKRDLLKAQTKAMWPYFLPGAPDIPATLYHYTNAAGLLGILKSKSLWASDLQFLNDRSELVYGHKLILDYLSKQPEPIAAALVRNKSRMPQGYARIYVVSFCEHGDLLSQWRGYSRLQDGYSIALRSSSLKACKNVFPIKLIYDVQEQEATVANLFGTVRNLFSQIDLPEEQATELIQLADYIMFAAAFRMKDNSIAAENEWRLVAGLESGYTEHFRVVDGHFVPYVKIAFDAAGLVEVRQGPGSYREANVGALERLLAAELFKNTNVVKSPVPL